MRAALRTLFALRRYRLAHRHQCTAADRLANGRHARCVLARDHTGKHARSSLGGFDLVWF